jgi:hypothetical protein
MIAQRNTIHGTRGGNCPVLLRLAVVILGIYSLPAEVPAAQVETSTEEGVVVVRHGQGADQTPNVTETERAQPKKAPRIIAVDDLLVLDGRLNLRRLGDVRRDAQPDYAVDDRSPRGGTFVLLPEVRRRGSRSVVTTRLALLQPGGGISLYRPPGESD